MKMAKKKSKTKLKKSNRQICELCGEKCTCKSKKDESKKIKVFICPNCRSTSVYHPLEIKNLWGLIPIWRCRKCKFQASTFPQWVIDKDKLNKMKQKK